MENENNISDLKEKFKLECEVVNLSYEYPSYTGTEKFGIITRLSEKELNEKYAKIIEQYVPFILLPFEMSDARREYIQNQTKYAMRRIRSESIFGFDDETEALHSELICNNLENDYINECDIQALRSAIKTLTEIQRRRIELYFFQGLSMRDIAACESVDVSNVKRSIDAGLKKMKIFLLHTATF